MKQLTYTAVRHDLETTNRLETELFVNLWASPDHLEALTAFTEKRRPIFNQQ